jgi:hypothetical protein
MKKVYSGGGGKRPSNDSRVSAWLHSLPHHTQDAFTTSYNASPHIRLHPRHLIYIQLIVHFYLLTLILELWT